MDYPYRLCPDDRSVHDRRLRSWHHHEVEEVPKVRHPCTALALHTAYMRCVVQVICHCGVHVHELELAANSTDAKSRRDGSWFEMGR